MTAAVAAPRTEGARRSGGLAAAVSAIRAHPDLACLALIVGLALFLRGQLVFRAPMFMQHDSIGYLLPAHDLATGQGFGVGFRRTPTYPLFLSGILMALGPSLTGILIVQHLLGAVTAGLTYWLGRATFGRAVGLTAGLLVAANGALIVGEHYLMSEGLFILLLLASLLALIWAGRGTLTPALSPGGGTLTPSPSPAPGRGGPDALTPALSEGKRGPEAQGRAGRYVLAGVLLALAVLCRPIAQALFPLVPLGLWLLGRPLREVVRGTLLVGLGVAALLGPWTLRTCLTAGECTTTGVVGQAMLARTAYYDKGFVFYDENDPERGPNAPRPAIRRSIQRASEQNFSGGVIARRLQNEFKWSDAETARIAREMALDVIRRQPLYYASGTLAMSWQLFSGEVERLRTDWKTQGRRLSRDEWDERVEYLLANPTPQQETEFPRAEAAINVWQPGFWSPWLPLLSLVGLGFALRGRGSARGAALLGLTVLVLLLVAAAINGPVPRYRYPADPLIAILAAGGVLGLLRLARTLASRVPSPASRAVSGGVPRGASSAESAAR